MLSDDRSRRGSLSSTSLTAVGTPFNGHEMIQPRATATRQIGAALKRKTGYHVVVVKSTVVPGTTDERVLPELESASEKTAGVDFGVGMNPEFLSEGEAVNDSLFPDRIVLGGIDERTIDVLERLYEPFEADVPRLRVNTRTAEMIKYASNSLLATLVSFSNELANLGAALGGIDTVEVMRGVQLSQYFRGQTKGGLPPITSFLNAGCGFGGSRLPKDVSALIVHGQRAGSSMSLLEPVIRINQNSREDRSCHQALAESRGRDYRGPRPVVRPRRATRESPAFLIMRELLTKGAVLTAYDPVARHEAEKAFPDPAVTYCDTLDAAIANIDAVIVVTPWKEFRDVPARLKGRQVVFVDGRRHFDKHLIAQYEGIGL